MTKKEIRHYIVCNLSYAATSTLIETKLYSQVIENIINDAFYSKITKKSLIEFIDGLNTIRYLGCFILLAFSWAASKESFLYWHNMEKQYKYYIIRF